MIEVDQVCLLPSRRILHSRRNLRWSSSNVLSMAWLFCFDSASLGPELEHMFPILNYAFDVCEEVWLVMFSNVDKRLATTVIDDVMIECYEASPGCFVVIEVYLLELSTRAVYYGAFCALRYLPENPNCIASRYSLMLKYYACNQ